MDEGQADMIVETDREPRHPTRTVRVTLTYATGEVAEIQIAKVGYGLRVVIAGDLGELKADQRGFLGTSSASSGSNRPSVASGRLGAFFCAQVPKRAARAAGMG